MAKFTWGNAVFVVREISRTAMLDLNRAISATTQAYFEQAITLASMEATIDAAIVAACPLTVVVVGQTGVSSGTVKMQGADGEAFSLTLPLTPATFNDLPASLAAGLIESATASNPLVESALKKTAETLRSIMLTLAPASGNGPSAPLPAPAEQEKTMTNGA